MKYYKFYNIKKLNKYKILINILSGGGPPWGVHCIDSDFV